MRLLACALLSLVPLLSFTQDKPHRNAHAHNDYEHTRPFLDALANNFISVEADVHLRKGKLRVGHNKVSDTSPLLEELYLKPLDSVLHSRGGEIYPAATFYLMIDIKTESATTYATLIAILERYPALCGGPGSAVCIFLSGNRPPQVLAEPKGCVSVDGRPADLGKGYSPQQMPAVSDKYSTWSSWNGSGKFSPDKFDRIRQLASRVHAEGKLLRLWAIPDQEIAWRALLEAGVDLINTDRLEDLHRYLTGSGL